MSAPKTSTVSTRRYHYTRMGVRIAPTCADGEGYVTIRTDYETLPAAEWTDAEAWTTQQEQRIAQWRRENC
jgi:hypothetical protein